MSSLSFWFLMSSRLPVWIWPNFWSQNFRLVEHLHCPCAFVVSRDPAGDSGIGHADVDIDHFVSVSFIASVSSVS
jgi:hypothetical protein